MTKRMVDFPSAAKNSSQVDGTDVGNLGRDSAGCHGARSRSLGLSLPDASEVVASVKQSNR